MLCTAVVLILRGTIVNRTYGIHKILPGTYLTIFTNNIRSYQVLTTVSRNSKSSSPEENIPRGTHDMYVPWYVPGTPKSGQARNAHTRR